MPEMQSGKKRRKPRLERFIAEPGAIEFVELIHDGTQGEAAGDAPANAEAVKDRCLGALVGLAIGDALGTTLEFSARDSLPQVTDMIGGGPFNLKPGEWTDDTAMALCLADSLLEQPGLDGADVMTRWLLWYRQGQNSCTGVCFDIGNQTAEALRLFEHGTSPPPTLSAGNGGIMRLAPAVIRWHRDERAAIACAVGQSLLTHDSAECAKAAETLSRGMLAGIRGGVAEAQRLIAPEIAARDRSLVKSTGYVRDTLEAALWALSPGDGFQNVVLRAVNLGEDADTVGAVAGQLAGAIWGLSGIPEQWLAKLAWRDRIIERACGLYEAAIQPGVASLA